MSKLKRHRALLTVLMFFVLSGVAQLTPSGFGTLSSTATAGLVAPSLNSETVPVVG